MKDEEVPTARNEGGAASDGAPLNRGRYKIYALAAILLLAFWSMFTGTVTLKWSAGNLNRLSSDLHSPVSDDLDVLEMEEREKVVRHMWDVYTHNRRIRLPRFWQDAFEAAYEELASDVSSVRDAAVAEIAKMSLRMMDLQAPPTRHSTITKRMNSKEEESKKKAMALSVESQR